MVTTLTCPLYDTHGNMVATLTKNASGTSWNVANERAYDVWGGVRSGAASGGPKGRYCANLGHVQDDESGLIYMRARYYEPNTGRFVSEDPAWDGINWYQYSSNLPNMRIDKNGMSDESYYGIPHYGGYATGYALFLGGFGVGLNGIVLAASSKTPKELELAWKYASLGALIMAIGMALSTLSVAAGSYAQQVILTVMVPFIVSAMFTVVANVAMCGKTAAAKMGILLGIQAMTCIAILASMDLDAAAQ